MAGILGIGRGTDEKVKIMQKRSVTPQTVNEFISNSPHFRNAASALLKIAKLRTDASSSQKGTQNLPNDILMTVPARIGDEAVRRSSKTSA